MPGSWLGEGKLGVAGEGRIVGRRDNNMGPQHQKRIRVSSTSRMRVRAM